LRSPLGGGAALAVDTGCLGIEVVDMAYRWWSLASEMGGKRTWGFGR